MDFVVLNLVKISWKNKLLWIRMKFDDFMQILLIICKQFFFSFSSSFRRFKLSSMANTKVVITKQRPVNMNKTITHNAQLASEQLMIMSTKWNGITATIHAVISIWTIHWNEFRGKVLQQNNPINKTLQNHAKRINQLNESLEKLVRKYWMNGNSPNWSTIIGTENTTALLLRWYYRLKFKNRPNLLLTVEFKKNTYVIYLWKCFLIFILVLQKLADIIFSNSSREWPFYSRNNSMAYNVEEKKNIGLWLH